MRTIQSALNAFKVGNQYQDHIQLADILSGTTLVKFHEPAALGNWASGTFFRSESEINTALGEDVMVFYTSDYEWVDMEDLKKGDLIQYDNHISIVYCTPDDNWGGECDGLAEGQYQIVHAYGERCTAYEKDNSCKTNSFSRKVLLTLNKFTKFPNPSGFGRIKLWD